MFSKTTLFLWLTSALASVFTAQASAQTCHFVWADHYDKLVRLTNDYDAAGNDSCTEPIEPGGTLSGVGNDLRETWYLAEGALAGTAPFARYEKLSTDQHADGPIAYAPPSNYVFDRDLGRAWTGYSRLGVRPVARYFKPSAGDYQTWLQTEAPSGGYNLNATWWPSGPAPALGYERHGNGLKLGDVLLEGYGEHTLENSFLRVEMNHIWGNAVGRITHKLTGKQIVAEPMGEMVQATLRFSSGQPQSVCRIPNPTQAGGADCSEYGETRKWAGSPVISTSTSPTDPMVEPHTVTSLVQPMEFCNTTSNGPWNDTQGEYPLIWQGYFERQETLGCKLGPFDTFRRDVLKMSTRSRLADFSAQSSLEGTLENVYWLEVEPFGDAKLGDFRIELVNLDPDPGEPAVQELSFYDPNGIDWDAADWLFDDLDDPIAVRIVNDQHFAVAVVRLDSADTPLDRTSIALNCAEAYRPACPPENQRIVIGMRRRGDQITRSLGPSLDSYLVLNGGNAVDIRIHELAADGGDCLD